MKNNTHNLNDPLDKKGYKKKYLIRKHQEEEAEEEIKEYETFVEKQEHEDNEKE